MHHVGVAKQTTQPNQTTRISIVSGELNHRDFRVGKLLAEGISSPQDRQRRVPATPMSTLQHPHELTLRSVPRHPADHMDDT
jgi:hypothetical protein